MQHRSANTCRRGIPAAAWAAVVVAVALSGCFSLEKKPFDKQHYVIKAIRPADAPPVAEPRGRSLAARSFNVAALFNRRELVYRLDEHRYTSDFYHQLFVSPDAMLTEVTLRWIEKSGLFEHVAWPRGPLDPSHILEGAVLELYGDFRASETAAAVLAVKFLIVDGATVPPQALFEREYRSRIELAERTPGVLADGLSRALSEALQSFETDLTAASW